VNPQYLNIAVAVIIFGWSLFLFYSKPSRIYNEENRFKGIAFNFWTAGWGIAVLLYLMLKFYPAKTPIERFLTQTPNNINNVCFFGLYSAYMKGKEFRISGFIRVWVPILFVITIWELTWALIFSSNTVATKELQFLILTPSLFMSMLALFVVGWGFYRRLGTHAALFAIIGFIWAMLQPPAYFSFYLSGNENLQNLIIWPLIFVKILVAFMFFSFILFKVRAEPVLRPPESQASVSTVAISVIKYLLLSAAGLLSLIQLIEWITDWLNS